MPGGQLVILLVHDVAALCSALNCVAPQGKQVESALTLADGTRNSPGGHAAVFRVQDGSALCPDLYSISPQGVHVASAMLPADVVKNSPGGHVVRFSLQVAAPAAAKEPAGHGVLFVAFALHAKPAGHGASTTLRAGQCAKVWHLVLFFASILQNQPAGQSASSIEPAGQKLPTRQRLIVSLAAQ